MNVDEVDRRVRAELKLLEPRLRKWVGNDNAVSSVAPPSQSPEFRKAAGRGIQVLPVPSLPSHAELLARALEGRKPFSDDGRQGYRDALVWQSLVEWSDQQAQQGHGYVVHFVTGNTRDFCENKSSRLHPDLAAMLPTGVKVEIVPDLESLKAVIAQLTPATKERQRAVELASATVDRALEATLGVDNVATWPVRDPVIRAGATEVFSAEVEDAAAPDRWWRVRVRFHVTVEGWVEREFRDLLSPSFTASEVVDVQGRSSVVGIVEGIVEAALDLSRPGDSDAEKVTSFLVAYAGSDGSQVVSLANPDGVAGS